MPFQNQVPMRQPSGYPGDWASDNVYYSAALIADTGGIVPGTFVSVETIANPNADKLNPKRAIAGGANAIGIALRSRIGVIKDLRQEAAFIINEAMPVEVIIAGDARVALTNYSTAVEGMKLFYNQTNGTVQAHNAGTAVAGYVETAWYVYSLDSYDGDNMVKASTYRKA